MKHIPLSLFSTQLISQLMQYLIKKNNLFRSYIILKNKIYSGHTFPMPDKISKRCFRFIVFVTDRFNKMRIYILKSSATVAFISLF